MSKFKVGDMVRYIGELRVLDASKYVGRVSAITYPDGVAYTRSTPVTEIILSLTGFSFVAGRILLRRKK